MVLTGRITVGGDKSRDNIRPPRTDRSTGFQMARRRPRPDGPEGEECGRSARPATRNMTCMNRVYVR